MQDCITVGADAASRRSLRLHAKKLPPLAAKSIEIVSSISSRDSRVSKPKKAFTNAKKVSLSRAFETRYKDKGHITLIGENEAGRGPLAGTLVVAVCHVPTNVTIAGGDDSEKMLEPQQEKLFVLLQSSECHLRNSCEQRTAD